MKKVKKENIMNLEDFNYELPEHLIAQTPLKTRTDSKLLILDKEDHYVKGIY